MCDPRTTPLAVAADVNHFPYDWENQSQMFDSKNCLGRKCILWDVI